MNPFEDRPTALRLLQRPSHRCTRAAIRRHYERRIGASTALWATKIARAVGLDDRLVISASRIARAMAMRATQHQVASSELADARRSIVRDICRVAHHFAVALDPPEGAPATPNSALRSLYEQEHAAGNPRLVMALGSNFRLYRPAAMRMDPGPYQHNAC